MFLLFRVDGSFRNQREHTVSTLTRRLSHLIKKIPLVMFGFYQHTNTKNMRGRLNLFEWNPKYVYACMHSRYASMFVFSVYLNSAITIHLTFHSGKSSLTSYVILQTFCYLLSHIVTPIKLNKTICRCILHEM